MSECAGPAENGPCCNGLGYLLGQGYECAEIPDGWTPVQRCDACAVFDGDDDAAKAAATTYGVEVEFFDTDPVVQGDEFFDGGPGDWAIQWTPPNLKRFKLEYIVTESRAAYVWAESESAARQCWIDDCLDSEWVEDTEHELERVYEVKP